MCLNCSFVALMRNNVCFVFAVTPFLDIYIYTTFIRKGKILKFYLVGSFLFKPSTQKLRDGDYLKDYYFFFVLFDQFDTLRIY